MGRSEKKREEKKTEMGRRKSAGDALRIRYS
jgi:hypothetical protein